MKITIVIPTYNEAENLKKLLPLLFDQFSKIKHDCHVLIVDGNSNDGTHDLVNSFSSNHPNLHLLVETKKEGLGAAYTKGFKHAVEKLEADVVMEMDGDMQHDPNDVPRFIQKIDEGYDYILGSRYVEGGSIPKEWAFHRKLLSWGGSAFARFTLGLLHIKDFTTGFKATRVKGILDKINLDEVMSPGFA